MTALSIAFVPGVSPAKWVRVWRERRPDVDLVLLPVDADGVTAAIEGDADMVFARMPVPDRADGEQYHAIPLWTETAVVATPKDSPLADLDEVTEPDLADVTVLDAGPVPPDVAAALDLVEANVGVVVLPQSLFRAASRKDLVSRPLAGSPGTRVALVWRDEDASELTEEFIGVVRGRTANSSRNQTDEPGGTDPAGADRSRPSKSGGKATAANAKTVAKRSATKGTGAKSGGGKNSTGRGRTQRGMQGKPKRGSKGNR
ncbi:LysR family transcriptional regulator substrate-binding protein [Curtobacterium sp. MCSS17_015]|uniref:LysR family transcriptional regulator substrate-binding protein n=1 Tax=Curtobacterium sp. MCSS17_015 TaxID=2175666 RepID=UPI001C64CAE3|nr:LysR family transcriptional regulator substrate-binding protein [Curtobacterium sp. MCSS17_015]WIB25559.1 LysR family transcriptional regulator substrate-binding protein [Curtobacterium sp. MCSS17_015]